MAYRFQLFRLSLLEVRQMNLLRSNEMSREEWLKEVFSEEIPFTHYGTKFHYSPALDDSGDGVVVGRIGKHVLRDENLPPEEGLKDFTRDTWIASVLVLDPTDHEDGQKLAIQDISKVGKPASLIRTLVQIINEKFNGPFQIEVYQIVDAESFWQYVEQNRGNITSVSFEFVAPNMIGADDDFHKEMRAFKNSERARKVGLKFQNEDGVNPETDRVRRAVNYALTESKGKVTAKAKGKPNYNSDNKAKKSEISDVKEKGLELVKIAKDLANRILGRE